MYIVQHNNLTKMKKILIQLINKKGFTLIELMVSLTVVSILSVIGVTVFGNAQANARDGKRKAEVETIAKAMELNYGKYKASSYSALCQIDNAVPTVGTDCSKWFGGSPGTLPTDPQSSPTRFYYWCSLSCPDNTSGIPLAAGDPPASQTIWWICADLERASGLPTNYCIKNQQ